MRKEPDESKIYFHEKKAINKVMELVELNDQLNDKENLTSHLPPLLISIYLDNN